MSLARSRKAQGNWRRFITQIPTMDDRPLARSLLAKLLRLEMRQMGRAIVFARLKHGRAQRLFWPRAPVDRSSLDFRPREFSGVHLDEVVHGKHDGAVYMLVSTVPAAMLAHVMIMAVTNWARPGTSVAEHHVDAPYRYWNGARS